MSEYALLVAVVGMGLVVILGLFGRATKQVWQNSESKFADEPGLASGGGRSAPYAGGGISAPYAGGGGSSSGGGTVSGDVHHTPPSRPPKNDSSDSTGSASADSLGSSPDAPQDVPQYISQGSR